MRCGECAALTWGDVDFHNKYILVRQTWKRAGHTGKTKNKRDRKVDLSDAAITALKAHRAKLQEEYLKKEKKDEDENKKKPDWVFPNREGNPHNMTNVRNRVFYRACASAGLHRRPLHSTRHLRDIAAATGRVTGLRERADGAFINHRHRGHLQALDSERE